MYLLYLVLYVLYAWLVIQYQLKRNRPESNIFDLLMVIPLSPIIILGALTAAAVSLIITIFVITYLITIMILDVITRRL